MITLDTEAIKKGQSGARAAVPVVPYYLHYAIHPSRALTTDKLGAILQNAERGNPREWYELVTDIFEKDPTIVAAFETRSHDVLTKSIDIIPVEKAGTLRQCEAQCAWVMDVLTNLSQSGNLLAQSDASQYLSLYDLLKHMLSAPAYGFSASMIDWDYDEWIPKAVRFVEHKHFLFGDPRRTGMPDYNPYELRIRSFNSPDDAAQYYGEPIEPYQFIVHYYRKSSLPNRYGLSRVISWWYLMKNFGMRTMLQYAELFGMPMRIGKYDASADATGGTDKIALEKAVQELGTDMAAVISSKSDIELVQPQGAQGDVQKYLVEFCDTQIIRAILGHASTTQATPGKLGKEDTAEATQDVRVESDARGLEQTLNSQLIAPMAVWRDGKQFCKVKIRYEAEENLNLKADRYVKLATIAPLGLKNLYETFDIPEPSDDEPKTQITVQASAPAKFTAHKHRSVVRNAQSQSRMQTAIAARDALLSYVQELIPDAIDIYATLSNDVNPYDDDAEAQIRKNIPAFRAKLHNHFLKACAHAGRIALESMGVDSQSQGIKHKNPSFNLKNDKAAKFLKWQAFSISVIEGEKISHDMFERIASGVDAAVDEGLTRKQFMERVMDQSGVSSVNQGHLTTIYRMNLATASNASMLFALEENKEYFPGWEFIATIDNNTTPECEELDGTKYENDDTTYFPPLHMNCRSLGSPISAGEWNANGYEASRVHDVEKAEGFENNAVNSFDQWVSDMRADEAIDNQLNQYEE